MDEITSSSIEGSFRRDAMGGHGESCGRFLPWRPMDLAFRRYGKTESSDGLRVAVGKSIVSQLTNDIVQTYQLCSPNFKHSETFNPRRYLTSPHVGVSNGGFDNVNSDLILSVNFSLINEESQRRYVIKEMLGHGTFGQVAKCWVPDKNEFVAVKVIKNQPAYYHQAIHEVTILRTLNQNFDPENKHHIVRMLEFFVFRCHLCISFEMLGPHLYDLLQLNNLKGLRMNFVQMFSKQILHALVVMKNAGIVHCDMKPENILVWTSVKPKGVKVIDFGSACKEGHTVYSYIQSRYYRSPEVLLGYPYNTAIDMWSFGCIVAELFLGLPLFPGLSEYDVLRRMIKILGGQPPDIILRNAKKTTKFFKHVGSIHRLDNNQVFHGNDRAYCFLTEAEYEAREQVKPAVGKWYFNHVKLRDIIAGHPYKSNLPEEEKSKEKLIRLALIDFVKGLIEFDPEKRWTPLQASGHPFVTGEPFTEPYCPPPVTYNSSVVPNIRVDNKADRGNWVASGFSPQVMHMSRNVQHSSPHMMPSSHGTGYGSYGSYNDNQHLVGSYDDTNKGHERSSVGSSGSSIPMHIVGSTLGASPDARSVPLYSYGSGFAMSPTETFRPFPLGVSPSQFTLPRSQIQVSNASPGKYDLTSPAKGSSYGSLLGKVAAAGQYNKGSLGCPGTVSMQHSQDASQHWGAHQLDDSLPEQIFLGFIGSPHSAQFAQSSWQQERDASEVPSGLPLLNNRSMHSLQQGNRDDALHSSGSSSHPEGVPSPLHPGDWDPNYSEVDVQAPRYLHTQSIQSSVLDIHSGYNHPTHLTHQVSHFSQSSSSHFAQQPAHRYDQMQSFLVDGDMNCPNIRLINYTCNSEDPRPPAYSASGQ